MLNRIWLGAAVLLAGNMAVAQTLDDVKAAYNKEDYKTAKDLIDKVIATDPKNPEFNYWKGTIYFENEDYDVAKGAFDDGIKKRRKYALNHTGIARVAVQKLDTATAHTALKEGILYDPNNVEVLFAAAQAYTEFGRCGIWKGADTISNSALKEAETILLQAQSKAPNDPRSFVALGDYYFAKRIYELALDNYKQAITKDAKYKYGYLRIGQITIKNGKSADEFNEGLRMFNKAIELDANLAPAYKDRGELYFVYGNNSKDAKTKSDYYNLATEDYRKYVALTGNDLRARTRYASFLFLKGEYDNCLAELAAVEQAGGATTNLMRRLKAYCYYEKGDKPNARKMLDEYFQNMPAQYHISRDFEYDGKLALAEGDTAKAIKSFDVAIDRDPARIDIYETLAKEHEQKKEPKREAQYRIKLLESKKKVEKPVGLKDYYFLGIAQYRSGDYKGAEASMQEVVKLKADYVGGIFWLANSANKIDGDSLATKTWRAKPYYESLIKTIEADPKLMEKEKGKLAISYTYLAVYAGSQKPNEGFDCAAAKEFIDKAVQFDPSYEGAVDIKKQCEAPAAPATPAAGGK